MLKRESKKGTRVLSSRCKNKIANSKRSQISIFIIIAIVIVAGIAAYFSLKGKIRIGNIPARFMPIEEQFLSCIDDASLAGAALLGEQAGYIYLPEFEPGNDYLPSSNYLSIFGSPVPYWHYISGSNIIKEQMPSKQEIEEQLERYIEENTACDFSNFRDKGFMINTEPMKVTARILENKIDVSVKMNLDIGLENENIIISEHKRETDSRIGNLYDDAVKIYNKEKEEMFLEKYGLDSLFLNAPVTDAELSCSPKIWDMDKIRRDVKESIEENTMALKAKKTNQNDYFAVGADTSNNIQFFYSKNWPTKIETQDENGFLKAEPVGNQEGFGIMGFCYIPYHFVYDMIYPVLIKIYDEKEMFQFPVSVIIRGNKERQALPGSYFNEVEPEVCRYKNQNIEVYTYDSELEPVEAEISFKCFNEECAIGKTKKNENEAVFSGNFPQCVNGFIMAKAEGYEDKKEMVSTNNENSINLILDRIYSLNASMKIDSRETNEIVIVYFQSEKTITSLIWPEQKTIKLSEGLYNISAFAYRNASITLASKRIQQCVKSPKPGFLGFFGSTEENCFEHEIPSQEIQNVLAGGGKSQQYLSESELKQGKVEIQISSLAIPKSIEELQKNYELAETNSVYMDFGQ